MNRKSMLLMVVLTSAGFSTAADWELAVEKNTTVAVRLHGAPVVTATYIFWGAKWKWAGAQIRIKEYAADGISFQGQIRSLGITLQGKIVQSGTRELKYTYEIQAGRALRGIIGGGLEFHLELNSPSFGPSPPAPELLEGNRGWRWPTGQDQAIEVSFEPALPSVYFERGRKSRLRAMLLGTNVNKGLQTIQMTVRLPEGGKVVKSAQQRYGPADHSTWHRNALLWNKSPIDLSFLNDKPAGKRGFVQAKGDELVFEDGTPARFWGGNIAAYAIFASKQEIEDQARRIASLGYNLMRFHHHDSTRWVRRTVIDKSRKDSQHLDAEVMDRLDYWIYCLKQNGVYSWLDLHVGRQFKDGDEQSTHGRIEGFEEIKRKGGEIKGFCYFNPAVQGLMQDFQEKYLNHVNAYTKLAYKEEPAIMGLLITNENDLTHHFGNLMLPDKKNPVHNRLFMKSLTSFCEKTGLPRDKAWRTWEHGPSKIFLNEQEHRFNRALLGSLNRIGARVPAATTNTWGANGLSSLPALTDGGLIDVHSYGSSEALEKNPRYDADFLSWIAAGQVYGKPVSITEWNVPYPNADRFIAPMRLAACAALQGWDAPMIYNYSQRGFGKPSRPARWSTFTDPAITAAMPAAALAFRQGHVRPARKTYCLKLSRKQLYFDGLDPRNSAAIRSLAEISKLTIGLPDVPELDWDNETRPASGTVVVTDPNRDFIPTGRTYTESDTGELRRDWQKGIFTINTARTQCAAGWLKGENLRLTDCSFKIDNPKAIVVVSSLDGNPIRSSGRILLTTVARVEAENGRMPFLSEPVTGEVLVRARGGLGLVAISPDGSESPVMPVSYRNGAYDMKLTGQAGTHWYLLK